MPDDRFATPLELVIALGQVFGAGVQGSTQQFAELPTDPEAAVRSTAAHAATALAAQEVIEATAPRAASSTTMPTTVRRLEPKRSPRGAWAALLVAMTIVGASASGLLWWWHARAPAESAANKSSATSKAPQPESSTRDSPGDKPADAVPTVAQSTASTAPSTSASGTTSRAPRAPNPYVRPRPVVPPKPPQPDGWEPIVPDR